MSAKEQAVHSRMSTSVLLTPTTAQITLPAKTPLKVSTARLMTDLNVLRGRQLVKTSPFAKATDVHLVSQFYKKTWLGPEFPLNSLFAKGNPKYVTNIFDPLLYFICIKSGFSALPDHIFIDNYLQIGNYFL